MRRHASHCRPRTIFRRVICKLKCMHHAYHSSLALDGCSWSGQLLIPLGYHGLLPDVDGQNPWQSTCGGEFSYRSFRTEKDQGKPVIWIQMDVSCMVIGARQPRDGGAPIHLGLQTTSAVRAGMWYSKVRFKKVWHKGWVRAIAMMEKFHPAHV